MLAAALLWLAAGLRWLVLPDMDEPSDVDAVVVLGPAWDERVQRGVQLVREGYSSNLVISVHRTDQDFCAGMEGIDLHCIVPEPDTTDGEAAVFAQLAAERGWRSAMIVTMRPHITRAKLRFEQAFSGQFLMIDDERELPLWFWARQFFYETGAFMKFLLVPPASDRSELHRRQVGRVLARRSRESYPQTMVNAESRRWHDAGPTMTREVHAWN